jgi:hypothetical protein
MLFMLFMLFVLTTPLHFVRILPPRCTSFVRVTIPWPFTCVRPSPGVVISSWPFDVCEAVARGRMLALAV